MDFKFTYLLNGKLNINGRQIYCKVTGKPGSANDSQPYVLIISGGPGFSHEHDEVAMRYILAIAEKEKKPAPHFIFMDNLGCGQSDKALRPDEEYTVDNFTDLAASLVEAIKDKLNLQHLNLYVQGGSFGSVVAMNFPARKPEWLDPKSDIQLKQVISLVGCNGSGMSGYSFRYLEENYSQHPNYQKIVNAQRKLFSGTIQNNADYVRNFILPIAGLYNKDYRKSFLNRALESVISYFPNAIIRGLDLFNRLFKRLGIEINALNEADDILGKCSLDVLNHFFKNDFNGFNVVETVKKARHLYHKVPICLIAGREDHISGYKTAETINQLLPETSAVIIFNAPHMIGRGKNKEIYNKLRYDLLVSGSIAPADVGYPDVIMKHTVTPEFNKLLSDSHQQLVQQSTEVLLTAMPPQTKENPPEELNSRHSSSVVSRRVRPEPQQEKEHLSTPALQ